MVDTPAPARLEVGWRTAKGAAAANAVNEPGTLRGITLVAAVARAADETNTPLGATHATKGAGPVTTTKGTGVHGPLRVPTKETGEGGCTTFGDAPATGGAHSAASEAANTPHNARVTLR